MENNYLVTNKGYDLNTLLAYSSSKKYESQKYLTSQNPSMGEYN